MEAIGEKLFGTELFEEFPVNERKVKLEEQVNFFQYFITVRSLTSLELFNYKKNNCLIENVS